MQTMLILFCCLSSAISGGHASFVNAVDVLAQHIVQLKPYQMVIVINNQNRHSKPRHRTLKSIILNQSVLFLDIAQQNLFDDQKRAGYQNHKSSMSTLVTIVQNRLDLDDIYSALQTIIFISHNKIRSKLLVIAEGHLSPRASILSILRYGWTLKFLDFTVISLGDVWRKYPECFNYNPFTGSFHYERYTLDTRIFPDKLNNMNGYVLKTIYLPILPYMMKRVVNNITTYYGDGIAIIQFMAMILKFQIEPLKTTISHVAILSNMSALDIDLMPFPFYLTNAILRSGVEIGRTVSFDRHCGIMHRQQLLHINLSLGTFASFLWSMLLLILLTSCLNACVGPRDRFSHLEHFRLLVSQVATRQPRSSHRRLLFFCIAFVSMTYSPNFVGDMIGDIVSKQDVPMETFKDVINSQKQTFIGLAYRELFADNSDPYFEILKDRTKVVTEMSLCLEKLWRGEDIICFLTSRRAEYVVNNYRRLVGSNIKIAKLPFPTLGESLVFQKASPFVNKFNQIMIRLTESGLLTPVGNNKIAQYKSRKSSSMPANQLSYAHMRLLILQMCGCLAAFITFLTEVFIHIYNYHKFNIRFSILKNF